MTHICFLSLFSMATAASVVSSPNKMTSVKDLAESPGLSSIPSAYAFRKDQNDQQSSISDPEPDDSIPIIDFSLLISSCPEQRYKAIHDLGKACQEWGFFMVYVNITLIMI